MPSVVAQPFSAAVQRLAARTPVASQLNSEQWQEMALGLRERAFFSAGVDSLRTVATMQSKIDEALRLAGGPDKAFMDRSMFVAEMRNELGAPDGDSGDLTDLASTRRLGLIYDFQMESATEGARWQAAQDPDLLEAFPCQELVRVESRTKPRDWEATWTQAGGRLFAGRMIARKDSPIWTAISRFGTPYPPYDFGSGMGVEDVDRDEAIALGVIQPDDEIQPQLDDFNAKLEASIPNASPEVLDGFKQVFGDQVSVGSGGKVVWNADALGDLYDDVIAARNLDAVVTLGTAQPETIAVVQRDVGVDLTGYSLQLRGRELRHMVNEHGEPGLTFPSSGERRTDQQPLTKASIKAMPLVWRAPTKAEAGSVAPRNAPAQPTGWPQSIRLSADFGGDLWVASYVIDEPTKTLTAVTAWQKNPPAP